MAELEKQELRAPHDERNVVVNGRPYYSKTTTKCPTCSSSQFMYLKIKSGSSYALECPNCDLVQHVLAAMVQLKND
jgi:hypothetical protein